MMASTPLPYPFMAFMVAMALYGIFGQPTPASLGWVEVVMGFLLLISLRLPLLSVTRNQGNTLLFCLFLSVLIFPALIGVFKGYANDDILRDMIAYVFLGAPFLWGWMARDERTARLFLMMMGFVGLSFAGRTLLAYQPLLTTPSLWGQGAPADLLYLANSPEVLWTALVLLGMGGWAFYHRQWIRGGILWAMMMIPLLAMALMMQRAGLGMVIVYMMIGMAMVTWVRPRLSLSLWGLGAVLATVLYPVATPVFAHMIEKTELVGFNSRLQEWQAVMDITLNDAPHFLFGIGWGGRIENPAVGGLNVLYTHSLLSALWLKTGFLGGVLTFIMILTPVFKGLERVWREKSPMMVIIAGATLAPFLVSGLLYASYKSLGFGFILLTFFILAHQNLEKKPHAVP